jgi:FMN phosphatase YigB (HAD superfamily)
MKSVRHLVFDFGGCIDAPGIHTRVLFWEAFRSVCPESQRADFQEAYTQADQQMMKTGEAKELSLQNFNRWNARLIAQELSLSQDAANRAGDSVTARMDQYLRESKVQLEELRNSYPLSIISNFTGNLEVILGEYGLRELFSTVTESYYEGISKPDSRIFLSAQKKIGRAPAELVYVGDNPKNDIEPAKLLGWQAVLIGDAESPAADAKIQSLRELKEILF